MSLIHADRLTKTYQMGTTEVRALDAVSFEIHRGEYVAIMGSSGSGKSTLLNLLGCLDVPTEGILNLNGKKVSEMDDDELAEVRNREIGFVFQSFNLLPRSTVLANVALPLIFSGIDKEEREDLARAALQQVSMDHRLNHRPNQLSGGQRQRTAIARALVTNPSILLADEPTGNLDSKTAEEIMGLFDELSASGRTVVLVTHESEMARHAQRIIRISDGRIACDEPKAHHHFGNWG